MLTPRVRVRFVKATDTAEAVIVAAAETGHSRFPVSGEDSDDVIGLVHLKRAVAIPPDERRRVRVEQLIVPVPIVPGSMPLDDLLDQLRERGLQMAVVADEYGGTAGILTLEDVVEELVGEIKDEHDPVGGRAECRLDDTWLLPGHPAAGRDRRITGVHLPESGAYETVAGLLIARLGPDAGRTSTRSRWRPPWTPPRCSGVPDGQVGRPDDQPIEPDHRRRPAAGGHGAADRAPAGPPPDRDRGAVRGQPEHRRGRRDQDTDGDHARRIAGDAHDHPMVACSGLVVVLLAASAFFVAAEFALIAARRTIIEPMAVNSARARSTLKAMENVSLMMACAQLGITLCGVLLGALGEPAVAALLEPVFESLGVPGGMAAPGVAGDRVAAGGVRARRARRDGAEEHRHRRTGAGGDRCWRRRCWRSPPASGRSSAR